MEEGCGLRMRKKIENFKGYTTIDIGHGRANLGTGRANILTSCLNFSLKTWHDRAILSTGRANLLVLGASDFSVFLESHSDNYLQNT
jgi:hypothetical protein